MYNIIILKKKYYHIFDISRHIPSFQVTKIAADMVKMLGIIVYHMCESLPFPSFYVISIYSCTHMCESWFDLHFYNYKAPFYYQHTYYIFLI
jgi:hypothetical protein